MTFSSENMLLVGSILLFISVMASKRSFSMGVPTLILFLLIGMLAGSEGFGGIYFDDPKMAQIIGIIALNFILFSGGLDTKLEDVKPVLWRGLSLSTIGVLVTTIVLGLFVTWVTDLSLREGLLLGAIVSSTDAAAVFSILRTKKLSLKSNLQPTLELESGSNDPMAFFLTISFTFLVAHPVTTFWQIVPMFFSEMIIGAIAGFVFGRLMIWITNKINLDYEGLYPVLIMALHLFTYSFTDFIGGNGFLSIYIAALVLGNHNFVHRKKIIKHYDGWAWLMQIIMFLTLGLLVFPSHILPYFWLGLAIALVLMFVARPVAVFTSLMFSKTRKRERLFLSWVGLRGAVPIVFATYPLIAGLEKADVIFNLVFFISVTSVLLQGTTLPWFAKKLGAIETQPKKVIVEEIQSVTETIQKELVQIKLPEDCPLNGKPLVNLDFPKNAMIVLIERDDKYIIPNGSTILMADDNLLITAENAEALTEARLCLRIKQPPPNIEDEPVI